jgi:hypothetical protein
MALRTAAAALALAVLLAAGTIRAHAQESTPTFGPPPTPPAGAPAAPANLVLLGYVAYWEDNSDNEDGFRLRYRVFIGEAPDRRETYEARANATTFALPPDAPRLCGEGGYYALDLQIVAFNARRRRRSKRRSPPRGCAARQRHGGRRICRRSSHRSWRRRWCWGWRFARAGGADNRHPEQGQRGEGSHSRTKDRGGAHVAWLTRCFAFAQHDVLQAMIDTMLRATEPRA